MLRRLLQIIEEGERAKMGDHLNPQSTDMRLPVHPVCWSTSLTRHAYFQSTVA
jgi:hypothetical protein